MTGRGVERQRTQGRSHGESALQILQKALGRGTGEPSGGMRWKLIRASTGTEVLIELEFATTRNPHETVWVFDPDGRGLSGAYSFEVSTPEGLGYLEVELRRLLGHDF